MEVVIAISAKIAEYTVAPIGRWLCYSFHFSSNIRSVKNEVAKLRVARDNVQHSVDAAARNGEKIEAHVTAWLTKVDETTEEARKFLEDEERAHTRCSNGSCLNLMVRHQLSWKAKKMVQVIGGVLENGRFDRVSYRSAPQGIVTTRCIDYVGPESRMLTVKRLMETLRDDKIHVIGVWGMAGVGKTTLVREVATQAKEENLFDEVVIANVTHSQDLRRIQGEIADMLGLKFDVETVLARASLLRERLTKEKDKKMILVILDDIWKNLDLEEIGIPSKGCKLLLTSRDRDVLCSGMGSQKDFGLEVLAEEEAWNLFEKMAGDCVEDPNFRCTATEVAKECAGLPLALVTVSKALRNKSLYEWKGALQLLRRPALGQLTEMQSKIYSSIELSYKHLESEDNVREIFLLCSQLGYYVDGNDLLKYCYGLGLFHGISAMEDARNRLYTILRILKDCSLLLQSPYSSESLCMHDVVRDAAQLIASRDHNMFLVRADGGLKEWPDADALKRCGTFSVCGVDIHELPNEMECPELRFLFLHSENKQYRLQISDSFFEGMGKLRVLALTQMKLSSSILSSLCFLRNLQTLCLDHCIMLGDLAAIGELENLAVLSLSHSNISQLPREVGLLSRLRVLDLSNCFYLEVIPPNVLSNLVALEELYMGNSFDKWEAEGLNNASLAELKHLAHLMTLEIHIPDVSNLPKDLLFDKLERYLIFVGDAWNWSDGLGDSSKTLKLKLNTSFQLEFGIKILLKRAESLYLDEVKGVESVLNESDREGFQQLKHLLIQNNPEIKYIIISRMHVIPFPTLETIRLENMTGLEEICHGQLPLTSFGNLRVVKVERCGKLKFVFSLSIAKGLSRLEELEIRYCSNMGAIVVKEESEIEEEHTSLFPQLRRVALEHLPKLMSFLSTQNSVVTDAGEIISEAKPDFHMPILHEQVVFPKLESLQLSSIDVQHNQHQATRSPCRFGNIQSTSGFLNLSSLVVKGSGQMKYLLSFSTASYMVQLKYLDIIECKVMEEILVTEELGVLEEIIPVEWFPQLESLKLMMLPNLKRFCEGSNIKFPCLKNLMIDHCPKLKTFISKPVSLGMMTSKELKDMNAEESPHAAVQPLFNEEVAFPSLEYLEINRMGGLKIIWRNQLAVDSFCKLLTIIVASCENLMNVFQSDMLARFQSLEELIIDNCGSLQEVFELDGLNVRETHAVTAIQLKKLDLIRLPKMKHVWKKDPQEIFSFQNLKDVRATECESLKSLFPASVARCLMQLEQLRLINCGVEEIVAGEGVEGAEAITRFVFPQVTRLYLASLPRLKCFYPGRHVSEWPMLKDISVRGCHEVDIFASELLSETLQEGQLEISIKQSLLLVDEVVFPNLETLRLSSIGFEDIHHNQHRATRSSCSLGHVQSTSRFQNLSFLEVEGSDDIKYLLSFSTARYMVQLKDLRIMECKAIEDILVSENLGVAEEMIPIELFPRLQSLFLTDLPNLKRFCEGSNIKFPSLMKLMIDHCPKLKTFISTPVSLGMMTSKELKEKIAEESPHTTVQPLFNEKVAFPSLEYLGIFHMDDLKIIWTNQFAMDSFDKLQRLDVHSCENIVNIFQSDMLTKFQSLEMLWVSDCGSLQEVYELQGPNITETHVVTAIQLKTLYLSWLPNMRHVWSKDPKPVFSFHNLQRVRVARCTSLKSLFPASVARCLTRLEQLVIVDCKVLEEIVAREEAVQPIARFVFPQVTVLHLAVLPRLKWFYPGVHTSEWSMLKDMLVVGCPKVVIFASELLSFQELQESQLEIKQPLFLVDEVPFPSLEKLRIFYMDDLKIIWHNVFTADSFCRPQIMKVEFCDNLTVQETCAVTATQLKELHLSRLPKLKHIWNKDPQEIFSFQNPLEVDAMGCESMESPIPDAEDDFPALQDFMYNKDGIEKIVFRNQNASVFVSFEDHEVKVQEVPHHLSHPHPSRGRDGGGLGADLEQTWSGMRLFG